jgi:hypothetical protein
MAIIVRRIPIATGDSSNLQDVVSLEEQHIPEGGLAELVLKFRLRPPGFITECNLLDSALKKAGVTPWPGNDRLVYFEEDPATVYIRWQRGMAWAPIVLAAIPIVLVTLLVLMTLWQFNRAVPVGQVMQQYPWVGALFMLGVTGLLFMFLYKQATGMGIGEAIRERVSREVVGAIRGRGG